MLCCLPACSNRSRKSNRLRFLREVIDAISDEIGAEHTAILNPATLFGGNAQGYSDYPAVATAQA